MSRNTDEPGKRQISGDRETIRRWAREHDAVPVRDDRPAGEMASYTLVPEDQMDDRQEHVEWDTFLEEVDEGDHVVAYHEDRTDEPFEVTGREEVLSQADEDLEERLLSGETVTTDVTETRVIESVVVEEATVESELVDSEIVDHEVVDVEFLGREISNVDVVEDEGVVARDRFDADRYVDMLSDRLADRERTESAPLDRELPYHVEFDVDERWTVTMNLVERFDVESRVTDADVSQADTIEDYDIDVDGLHRSIVESGIIDVDHTTDEVLNRYDVESELAETDRIRTSFTRERTVEDEVLERKHLEADVTAGETLDIETTSTRDVETRAVESEQEVIGDEAGADVTAGTDAAEVTSLDDDDLGKTVVGARGKEIGQASDITDDGTTVMVDTNPGLADRITSALGWGSSEEDDYPLQTDQIDQITEDEIRLQSEEHLGEIDRRG